jgi:methylglutaconyl-CoA hydratase
MTTSTRVKVEIADAIATVTLNEPEARNPLSPELVVTLTDRLNELANDDAVRAIVLVGAGKGFSAGADLRRMRTARPLEDRDEYDAILELNRAVWNHPKPTIAAVHGFALGAGANLVGWCDLAVMDEEAVIGYPEVRAGVPSATVIPSLMRLVGRKSMFDLILTGVPISATEAQQIGLVTRVAPAGKALPQALDLAGIIASRDPGAVAFTKKIAQTTTDMAYGQAVEYAKEMRVMSRLRDDFDVQIRQGGSQL